MKNIEPSGGYKSPLSVAPRAVTLLCDTATGSPLTAGERAVWHIQQWRLKNKDKLPSVRQLAAYAGVSVGTAQKALKESVQ